MARAFLSHSTDDKAYVDEVAERLGRARAHIDTESFRPGEDFRDAIRRTLDEAEIFVFFVSAKSLASSWVKFELDEAEIRTLRGTLRRSLAIFIDGPVNASELPDWLARVRAVQHTSPGQSARTIESLLLSSTSEQRHPFIGRHDDLQRGVRKLSTTEPLPRILVVSGLQGVGRRSYLSRLLADALNLDLGPVISLSPTATLEDLFIESHLSATMLSRADAERQIEAFRALSVQDQSVEVAEQLAFLAKEGSAPCVIDHGSMLDSVGKYFPSYAGVFEEFVAKPDVYLCVVHSRAPDLRDLSVRSRVLERRLRPLEAPDAQSLIARLLRESNVRASPEQTAGLAEATGGYPPAAYFIVSQVEDYGIDVVLGDASRTTDFYTRSFSRFIRDLKLAPVEHEILVYLASETRLSLAGIVAATGHTLERTATAVRQLVDLSIVEAVEDEYTVTAPIQITVLRTEDALGRKWYEAAFARLEDEYWIDEKSLPPISVVDATLRAAFRIGRRRTEGFGALVRPSLLIHAAQEMYHRRDYASALEYLERAESMGGGTPQLLEVRIKSLAQLRRFSEAREALRDYRNCGERRQWYLDGFVERKAGEHDRACSKFQRGYALGDRSVSLLRDYADSLLRTDAISEAGVVIGEAVQREPGSIYVLDLAARIEIAGGTHEAVERALAALEAADVDEQLVLHRRASYLLYRRGNAEAVRNALALAKRATRKRDAPLEAFLVLAKAQIKSKAWHELEGTKQEIEKRRQRDGRSILRSLDLEAAIARAEWRTAEKLLPSRDRSAVDRDRRAAVLELKGKDRSVLLDERQEAQSEASKLREERDGPRLTPVDTDLYE